MLQHLVRFFQPSIATQQAYLLYARLNDEARCETCYTDWGVPDTLDGRFECILLHLFLYITAMKREGAATEEMQRRLIEAFFEDMDRSVRELGVSDTGVGKRVKAMANALYGRLDAYRAALNDDTTLHEALRRNLYGTTQPPEAALGLVSAYMRARITSLTQETPWRLPSAREGAA